MKKGQNLQDFNTGAVRLAAFLVFFPLVFSTYGANVDSLLHLYSHPSHDSVKLRAMLKLAWEYRNTDTERSIELADEATELAVQIKDTASLASAYLRKALTLRKQGQLERSRALIENAIQLKKAVGDSLGLAAALGNLSQVNKLQGEYDKAIANRLEAIQLLAILGNKKKLASAYNNLAGVYADLGQSNKAIAYYKDCLNLAIALNDSGTISHTWYNLGAAYFDLKKFRDANQYYSLSLDYASRKKDRISQARLQNSIGALHYERQHFSTALKNFNAAESLCKELGFKSELALVYNNKATVYAKRNETERSVRYYLLAARLASDLNNPRDLHLVYYNLSEGYTSLGQTDSAFHYFQLYTSVKDSLFNVEKNRQIVEIQEKFESVQKDKSIAELNQVKAEQEAEIRVRNILLGGIGVVSLLAIVFGVNYFQKLRAQKALATKVSELNQQKMMDLITNNELKTVNAYLDGETSERERLAGELHDHLGSRLATVKLHYDHLAAMNSDKGHRQQLEKANALLGEALGEVRKIAHNLTSGVLNKFGLVPAIEDLCAAISTSGKLEVQLDAFELDNRLPPSTELSLFRAVQELLTNTIKHANATEASVQLVRHEDHITIVVADNGKGFDLSGASSNEGIGLRHVETRVTNIGGTFSIDTRPGYGTTGVIELPI